MKKIGHRTFASIAAAAKALKVSESIIKEAKVHGGEAAGFHPSGRIDEAKLVRWIAANKGLISGGGASLRDRKLAEEVRKLTIANDLKEKKLIPIDAVIQSVGRVLAAVDTLTEQIMVNELPAMVAGIDVPQARIILRRAGDRLRDEWGALGKEWH